MSEVSAPWLHATLADAAESLAAALEKLEAHTDEETASELLRRDLVEEMPFATLEELDAAAEEEEQKALNADD